MLCIAYSNPLLSRTHAAAFPVPFRLRPSPVTGWPTGRRLVDCNTWRAGLRAPQAMLLALRRRLRLPLPLCASRCGPPGCGGEVDALGDHALACNRSGRAGGPPTVAGAHNSTQRPLRRPTPPGPRRLRSDASRRGPIYAAMPHLCRRCHAQACRSCTRRSRLAGR